MTTTTASTPLTTTGFEDEVEFAETVGRLFREMWEQEPGSIWDVPYKPRVITEDEVEAEFVIGSDLDAYYSSEAFDEMSEDEMRAGVEQAYAQRTRAYLPAARVIVTWSTTGNKRTEIYINDSYAER